jgi:ATP-dependent exoDNAse (exonuclease V) beta subunit
LAIDYLQDNFRSSPLVLDFTSELLGGQPGMEPFAFQPGRTFRTQLPPVEANRFPDRPAELNWLVAEVTRLRQEFTVEEKRSGLQRECRFSDIAILVRNSKAGEAVAAALGAAGIPAALSGGRGFFDNQEVIDLLQYFTCLANPRDAIAMATVLRSPLVGLSDGQIFTNQRDPAFEAFFAAQRQRLDFAPPDLLLSEALDFSGYTKTLNAQGRANIARLLEMLRAEWSKQAWNARQFADHLAAIRAAWKEKTAAVVEAADSVQILTVHKSKGLEFPVVLLAFAQQTGQPSRDSLRFAAGVGVGVHWRNPVSGKKVADAAMRAIAEAQKEKEAAESHRLLFVALTRAEQKLAISWHGKNAKAWASFLKEISTRQEAGAVPPAAALALPASPPAEELLPLASPPSPLASATPSGLATYANCPRRYYLDQLCGLSRWPEARPTPGEYDFADGNRKEDANVSAAALGTEVHEYLAGLLPREPSPLAKELATVFARSPLAARAARAERVEKEFDFVFAEAGLVIEGQIDLWFIEGGEAVIVDYKTDRIEKEDAPAKARAYALQMAVYRRVIARLVPDLPVRAYLHFLRPDALVEIADELDAPFLASFAAAADYPALVAAHCQRCPHARAACDAAIDPAVDSAANSTLDATL